MESRGRPSDVSAVPAGTVSFLFTDIEGSTRAWEVHGDAMRAAVTTHDALLHDAICTHRGYVFKTVGDAFCAAFHTTSDAVAAACTAQGALTGADWGAVGDLRVRMAVHVGSVESRDGDYFGRPLNKVANLLSTLHGGQVVLTAAAFQLAGDTLPAGARLDDLGLHRLKDLEVAEHVFGLVPLDVPSAFPPLRSLDTRPNNLPVVLTSFVGRERELDELRASFGDVRLLTLTGTGGVGKTRIALALAADMLDRYDDGVWFIELSPIAAGDGVPDEVATTLSLQVNAKEPVTASIVRALRDKRALILLDNCEHVVAAAAQLASAILRACPSVDLIATSREHLHIPGERVHTVGVLDLPPTVVTSAVDALASSAVRLFVDRAFDASTRFALTDGNAAAVADICRRLDGIALAIELAASKVTVLSPRQINEHLTERFRLLASGSRTALPRQQTLRALIDWSYDLLDADEQRVFRYLGVFAGSFSLEAVNAMCADAATDAWRSTDILTALVTKSLVVVDQTADEQRYRLLDSMRDYARARLEVHGEEPSAVRAHAEFYRALLARAERELVDETAWTQCVAPEVDNIRAALDAAFRAGGDSDAGLALLVLLESAPLVVTAQEAARWFADGAAAISDASDPGLAAGVLNRLAKAEWYTGAPIVAREATATRAVFMARASAVDEHLVSALTRLGSCLCDAGRLHEADDAFREADEHAAACCVKTVATLERCWGINDLQRGDLASARRRFTRDAQLETPGSEGQGSALLNLAEIEYASGDRDAALRSARLAKTIYEKLNAPWLALLQCNLGAYALAADRLDEAAAALHEAVRLLQVSGAGWLTAALEHCALLAMLSGDPPRAARLLGFTHARYTMDGKERPRTEQIGYDRLANLLRDHAPEAELTILFAAGAALTEGEAVAHATAFEPQSGALPARS